MKDIEIIEALELCEKAHRNGNIEHCKKCAFCRSTSCEASLRNHASERIKRKKEEIEMLHFRLKCHKSTIEHLAAENELLKKEVEGYEESNREYAEMLAEQTAEIKKLKNEMSYMVNPNTIGDRHEMGSW